MAKEHTMACGLHLCGQCSWIVLVFGLLFAVAGFNLWGGAPMWFNGWTLLGLFLLLLGASTIMKK